ncbi:hypothetical protein B0H34DRAFT_1115 [Crassisporium funariophilum]|nr:hypothetical protein B0H34DRAFT_1115 [Crassisporium funariophilum]
MNNHAENDTVGNILEDTNTVILGLSSGRTALKAVATMALAIVETKAVKNKPQKYKELSNDASQLVIVIRNSYSVAMDKGKWHSDWEKPLTEAETILQLIMDYLEDRPSQRSMISRPFSRRDVGARHNLPDLCKILHDTMEIFEPTFNVNKPENKTSTTPVPNQTQAEEELDRNQNAAKTSNGVHHSRAKRNERPTTALSEADLGPRVPDIETNQAVEEKPEDDARLRQVKTERPEQEEADQAEWSKLKEEEKEWEEADRRAAMAKSKAIEGPEENVTQPKTRSSPGPASGSHRSSSAPATGGASNISKSSHHKGESSQNNVLLPAPNQSRPGYLHTPHSAPPPFPTQAGPIGIFNSDFSGDATAFIYQGLQTPGSAPPIGAHTTRFTGRSGIKIQQGGTQPNNLR